MSLLSRFVAFSDRHFFALFILALVLYAAGFLLHSDFGYDESPYVTSYSLSLGKDCEANVKKCRVVARPIVAYRVETTRNEVVAIMPALDGMMQKYDSCTIWDASNWECEQGRIAMHDGVLTHNIFEPDSDVHYVPKSAWKLAKLRILPVGSVRPAPPVPVKAKAA